MADKEIPPCFKELTKYLKRAEEFEKEDLGIDKSQSDVIAYHCRLWAMMEGMRIRKESNISSSDVATKEFLLHLMTLVEEKKKGLKYTNSECNEIFSKQMIRFFDIADEEERLGCITKLTAKKFYRAQVLFEAYESFGPLSADISEKVKYCMFKATEIVKADRNGTLNQMNEANQNLLIESTSALSLKPASDPVVNTSEPVSIFTPSAPTLTMNPNNIIGMQQQQQFHPPQIQRPLGIPNNLQQPFNPSPDEKYKDVIEYCNYAITALKHHNTELAVERLKGALKYLLITDAAVETIERSYDIKLEVIPKDTQVVRSL